MMRKFVSGNVFSLLDLLAVALASGTIEAIDAPWFVDLPIVYALLFSSSAISRRLRATSEEVR